jgi:hypothetical protein
MINLITRLSGILAILVLGFGCLASFSDQPGPAQVSSPATCPLVTVSVSSWIPFDSAVNDQASLNCFAWQEFIALNWLAAGAGRPADVTAGKFGRPGDTRPVVWETYMYGDQLMRPDGGEPPAWGTTPELPAACGALGADKASRIVRHTSKFTSDFIAPDDLQEAAPYDSPNWLADRHGNPVFFEILVSEDEYNYAADPSRRLYNADGQVSYVSSGNHIDLPRGKRGVRLGSLELKVAWLQVDDAGDPRWQHYKLSRAYAWNSDDHCEVIDVALVGMHIVHKTESNPQWIWATFEHQDNATRSPRR